MVGEKSNSELRLGTVCSFLQTVPDLEVRGQFARKNKQSPAINHAKTSHANAWQYPILSAPTLFHAPKHNQ